MSAPSDPDAITSVPVALGERSYDILIGAGLIAGAGATIAARFPGRAVAIVTDETVGGLHGQALEQSLDGAGIRHIRISVPAGEATKRFAMLEQVVDQLLAARMERGDLVVALGGGVVGDLAGFAAAIVRRGMGFVQMPTSLLAQVDSSVGGKTGINSRHGKNLIGAFYQPGLVLADTDVLDTLSTREFRAGYAEVAKYGLIDDPGFFGWLEANWRGIFQGGRDRTQAIATSCRAKAAVVARDETETGDRALLNLGHTFGHALEAATGYDSARLVHGEGVAIGMAQAYRFSAKLGLCPPDDAERMRSHLTAVGLPTELAHIPGDVGDVDRLMTAIQQDKKVTRGALTFILTRGIGRSFIAGDVDPTAVRSFLAEELARR
ncbi:3-dehydroquinate synthase [Phreatobacter stygius]|uniref:3-dehydroquinate synthase n=1 Tax=Phreatobacter stygius TaxID=1940610 RepID=A0A4D7B8M0_9HYPH|nr:3-dehydroquinate synthase [Phreatobacter stygius]QCI64442.1 3-dehydroquinate synthase [Phreatobacter stygius]